MEPRISMITLGVADVDRAVAFYRDGLGFPLYPASQPGVVAFLNLSGTWLGLFSRTDLAADAGVKDSPAGVFSGVSLAHNVRTREAVAPLLAAAVKAGATLVKPASDADWGGHSGYFADPDGHLWEVAWNPHFWIG
ncbi:MAG: VOC family protein [Nitrospirota bacterium]|nr:VOC family protein [Nitrospirota bacterium]